jgi:hypothetical protein
METEHKHFVCDLCVTIRIKIMATLQNFVDVWQKMWREYVIAEVSSQKFITE